MRPWSMAWEETSIATDVTPSSRNRARDRCNTAASGVVRSASSVPYGPSIEIPVMEPTVSSDAVSPAAIRRAVLVLPLVPVTPYTDIAVDGRRCT